MRGRDQLGRATELARTGEERVHLRGAAAPEPRIRADDGEIDHAQRLQVQPLLLRDDRRPRVLARDLLAAVARVARGEPASASRRAIASRSRATSGGTISAARSPSNAATPQRSVTTTGVPAAAASAATIPKLSFRDGSTKTSASP